MPSRISSVAFFSSQSLFSSSANQILQLATGVGLPIADDVARRAREAALDQMDGKVAIEVIVFDRTGGLIGRANGW